MRRRQSLFLFIRCALTILGLLEYASPISAQELFEATKTGPTRIGNAEFVDLGKGRSDELFDISRFTSDPYNTFGQNTPPISDDLLTIGFNSIKPAGKIDRAEARLSTAQLPEEMAVVSLKTIPHPVKDFIVITLDSPPDAPCALLVFLSPACDLPLATPEPSTFNLLGLGALIFFGLKRQQLKRVMEKISRISTH